MAFLNAHLSLMRFTPHRFKIFGCTVSDKDKINLLLKSGIRWNHCWESRAGCLSVLIHPYISPQKRQKFATDVPAVRMRPLLANWKAISGMPMEQETFLSALASDFNMHLPYLEYMVQVPHQGGKGNLATWNGMKQWNALQPVEICHINIWRSNQCMGLKKPFLSWQNPSGKCFDMFSHRCLSAKKLCVWLLILLFAAGILLQLQCVPTRWAKHHSKNERNCSFVLYWR